MGISVRGGGVPLTEIPTLFQGDEKEVLVRSSTRVRDSSCTALQEEVKHGKKAVFYGGLFHIQAHGGLGYSVNGQAGIGVDPVASFSFARELAGDRNAYAAVEINLPAIGLEVTKQIPEHTPDRRVYLEPLLYFHRHNLLPSGKGVNVLAHTLDGKIMYTLIFPIDYRP